MYIKPKLYLPYFLFSGLWLILLITKTLASESYITFPSNIDWTTRTSPHFHVLYRKGEDTLSIRALKAAERAYSLLTPILTEAPKKTWIVLADFHDDLNGYGLAFPYPHMVIFTSPPLPSSELADLDDWFESVILHEYVHVLHLYPAHGLWGVIHSIFGKWIVPNGLLPSYLHEGLAVLFETYFSGHRGGRGNSTQVKMLKRVAVEERVFGNKFVPFDLLNGAITVWPQGESAYFFGYDIYEELLKQKGLLGISNLVKEESSSWPYLIDKPVQSVYGIDYESLWKIVSSKITKKITLENNEIKKTLPPSPPITYLTDTKFLKWDTTLSEDARYIAYRKSIPQDNPFIQIDEVSTQKKIREIRPWYSIESLSSVEGLCFGRVPSPGAPAEDAILYLKTRLVNHYTINQAFLYFLNSKKEILISPNNQPLDHLHLLSCSEDLSDMAVYRELAGKGQVMRLSISPSPASNKNTTVTQTWDIPEGTFVSGLLVRREKVFIAIRRQMETDFYEMNRSQPLATRLSTIKGHVFNLKIGPRQGTFYAISNLDGRDEIWLFNPSQGIAQKVFSTFTGVRSFDFKNNELIVSHYRQGGYDVAKTSFIPSKKIFLNSQPTPTSVNQRTSLFKAPLSQDPSLYQQEDYQPWSTLLPRNWLPSMLFVLGGVQVGAWIPGFDLSQKHTYDIILGYDSRGTSYASLDYSYRFSKLFTLEPSVYYLPTYLYNGTQFFLLKQWGYGIGLNTDLGYLPGSIKLSPVFKRLEPSLLGGAIQSVGGQIDYSYLFNFYLRPLSISPLRGTKISLSAAYFLQALGSSTDYFWTYGGIDHFLEAPWAKEHVWYFAVHGGVSQGTPLYNFFFQGGGDLIFHQQVGFFRDRGFYPGIFDGRRMLNANLEYRFPLKRVERGIKQWPIFLHDLNIGIIGDALTYDVGVNSQTLIFNDYYFSTGLELKSDWLLSYYIPVSMSLGAYHGFGPYGLPIYITLGMQASL